MDDHTLTVGTLYHPDRTSWQEGSDFNWREGYLELRLFFSNLTPGDIRAVQSGPCRFSFAYLDDVLFFLYAFGTAFPLSDSSYTYHLVPEDERVLPPELAPNKTAPLLILLVSANDGILRAVRRVFLGTQFSHKLFRAIRRQAERPFDLEKHYRIIAEVYHRYPDPSSLLSQAEATVIVSGKEGQN